MLWLSLAVMTAAAVALLLAPLWRAGRATTPRGAHQVEVYRDQLGEVERDLERGVLGPEEADAVRLEVERRMLAAAGAGGDAPEPAPRWRLPSALALALAIPATAAALYVWLGSPGVPSEPVAQRPAPSATGGEGLEGTEAGDGPGLEQAIAGLAARLEQSPDDVEGWRLLGRSYRALGRYAEAAAALTRASALDDSDPELFVSLGESLVFAAEGVVTPAANAAFRRAQMLAPAHPGPRYYLGLAHYQAGQIRAALDMWMALAADTAEDAPWRPLLLKALERVAGELGIDLDSVIPPPLAATGGEAPAPAAPGSEEGEALAGMSEEERQAFVRGMVERLAERMAETPDDLEGWLRLGRARAVLGEFAEAREAYGQAARLAPEDAGVLAAYGTVIVQAAGAEAAVPREALALFERALALDPDNADALWFTGLAAAQSGRPEAATAAWERLLATLDPASPDHAALRRRMDALERAE